MHVLAIDAGTTSITALVLDEARTVVGRAQSEFGQHHPQPGWVEQDAVEIHDTCLRVAKAACKEAGVRPKDLAGVGLTVQRETTVVWDRASGEPIHNAIVWQDRRTAAACQRIGRKAQKWVRQRTGLVVDPYFSASKVAWLLEHVDGARRRADAGELAFGTLDSWLAWKWTGQHVTDDTNASRTMLWDIHEGAWDDDLLELWKVPANMLPDVVPSSHVVGPIKALGGAPLAALVGDQQGALFGQGCFAAGDAKITYGTGCFLLRHTGSKPVDSKHGLLTTRAASTDATPQFALEGSVFIGGAAIQWLRDGIGVIDAAPDVNGLAQEVPDAGGVVLVPAFAGLGAPYWDAEARGAVLGITGGTTKAHLARATLDAIAQQCADVLDAMEKDAGKRLRRIAVDGGASRSDLLLQLQATVLRRPVERPENVETTALGAGYLAGLAVGAWTLDDLQRAPTTTFSPGKRDAAARKRWHAAVKAARAFRP